MYKSRQLFISSIIVYIFILALLLSGCGGQSNAEETISGYSAEETATLSEGRSGSIRWTRFSEHNYTFSLDEGRHEYAWYVLNAEDEPLYEVAYNDEPNFFFSFTAPEEVCVKGFVRTYIGDTYTETSYRVDRNTLMDTGSVFDGVLSWTKNHTDRYTFSLSPADTQYAWYVLDMDGSVIEKTSYSTENLFVYDLSAHPEADRIKGFIRVYKGKEYIQASFVARRYSLEDVTEKLRGEYIVVATELTEEAAMEFREMCKSDISGYYSSTLENLVKDRLFLGQDMAIPLDWTCRDVSSRSTAYRITGVEFLNDLFQAWSETSDDAYKEMIMSYMLDFVRQNPEIPAEADRKDNMVWHDDATGRRVQRMATYYDTFRDSFSAEEKQSIEDSLQKQAWLLMDDDFYTARHNHGMYQDIGVLSYALMVSRDEAEKAEMIIKALARMTDYIEYVYTEDGVHKEHSPRYALDVLEGLRAITRITETVVPAFGKRIGHYLRDNTAFLIQAVMPNYSFAAVGDNTSSIQGILFSAREFIQSDQTLYIRSGGAEGVRPADESVYPQGGYAFFRSSWADAPEEATWMMFLAATHSSTHKHCDDCSFLLYHKGELFVEAGSRDYNYTDPQTAWVYSCYAHNVLLIDGESFPVKIGENGFQSIYPEALKTCILDSDISGDPLWVKGQCERFPGVLWQRSLAYSRAESLVTITDELFSEDSHEGTLVFRLAEGITAQPLEDGWLLLRGEEELAQVTVSGPEGLHLNIYTGEGTEPFYTWIFNGQTAPICGTVLTVGFPCRGDNAGDQVVTAISLR